MSKSLLGPGPITLDVLGLELDAEDRRRILDPLTGGVILFGRNYQDRAQLTALTKAIKAIRSDVMISIDHEGGRVQRCRTDGFTHLPAMKKLGDIWCLITHDFVLDKHKMHKAYGPQECQICGRWWKL